ncbi:MAG: peptidylprolyl isomerase, partial [Acidobacteriota bacterium]|nr:peptidylprolyl isomerase [Acidobacteriota bacterium]
PVRARQLLPLHAADAAWPVRMYAATAATALGDDARLETLAGDARSNVREAAVAGLAARAAAKDAPDRAERQQRLSRALVAALAERRDPQLLRTAARAINATGDAAPFASAIATALEAVDGSGADTWIDARVALVDAYRLASPQAPYAVPAPARAPMTPSPQELRALPSRARIEMARGGVIELELLPDEAPATVARFARLAAAGYYDGLTIHRVEPNFVVQGGSPWANEYAGAPRFQRDELGFARHERGAAGISTRGRDTGDAQFFFDLVDLPRLNHDYTVFARVVSGMDVVDRILEADVISRIEVVFAR